MRTMADSADDLDYMLPANCPSPYFDSWDRHNSIAFSATKGLRNAPGENNCFVNCAVQVFWHLDVFRRSYRRLSGHTCMGNSCIFCALKVIFTQFQYSDKSSLHPDALRKALAETFANQQRFQLGHMDDAAECFENILRRIHFHIACNYNEDACSAPHCVPHQKFSMAVHEKVVCPCGASSSPLKFSEMVHYVSASALVSQSRMMQESGDALHPDRFGLLLRKAGAMGDVRDCPANCGKQVQKQRTLFNIPDVVSIGLVWDSDHPSMEMTTEVAGALGTGILLQDMYHRVMPDVRKLPRLQLVAVVCYYGKHYSTFVFHSKLQTWVYFDDATVREIGPQWENVVDKCSRGRFQPLLLLYANQSAAPVCVDSAPRKRVMAPGYTAVGAAEDGEPGLDRTHESLKGIGPGVKRATTPTPKLAPSHLPHPDPAHQNHHPGSPGQDTSQDTGRDSPARLGREHSRQPSFLFAVSGKNDKNKQEGGEGGNHMPGVLHPNSRRQLLDGGANSGRLETMAETAVDYTDYTLSSGDQYRRPSLNGADSKNQLPVPPNMSRYPDAQRKDSFTKRAAVKEKGGVDVVRYHVDPSRTSNHTPDFSQHQAHSENYSPHKGDKMGHQKPPLPHGRQRSVSSGREEEGGDISGGGQHVVVKPKPTGHGSYDQSDALAHTAVQSGLATLPRQKGHRDSDAGSHQRSTSTNQEVAQLTRKTNRQCMAVEPPLPPGTPPPEYNAAQESHSRQTSMTSQASTIKSSASMGHIDQVSSSKKTDGEKVKKKVKKEKKSEKDPSKKSEKKKAKAEAAMKKSESEGELVVDKSGLYIDRRMVENILKHQGVHRQNSSCSNNSVSSVESDSLMGKLLASKASSGTLTGDIAFDNMSLGSQKDSGYGSSDRNSSSSTGSGTVDPYTQYFISKSMVVPRSVNTQHLMEQHHSQYNKGVGETYGGQTSIPSGGHIREDGRLIMHPIKESSQEDMLKLSEPLGTHKFIVANAAAVPSESRLPPVPPKNFAQYQIIKSSQPAGHERESSLDSLDKDETIADHFVSLCKKADALMDSCMLAETSGDITAALSYCDGALGCLKEAMNQKELNNKALAYVQKKHNSCLLKSRTLIKRGSTSRQESLSSGHVPDIPTSVGNRSSITSSDSDMSDQYSRQARPDSRAGSHQHRSHPAHDSPGNRSLHERHHSASRQGADNVQERQHSGSRQGGDNKHERQHSASRQGVDGGRQGRGTDSRSGGRRDSSVSRTYRVSTPSQDSGNHHRSDSNNTTHMPPSHSANYLHAGNVSGGESGSNSADLYGTLPRNKSRKPTSESLASSEVYQSFLNKQKSLQAGVVDNGRSDSGSDHSTSSSHKMGKPDMRPVAQNQWQQSGGAQYPPQQTMAHGQYPPQQTVNQSQYISQQTTNSAQYPSQQANCKQYPPQQTNSAQYPPQQTNSAQYPPQQTTNSAQYPSQQTVSSAQYPHQQDVRQFSGPSSQRPGQTNTQYPPAGHPSWQQQQQQQQQYHHQHPATAPPQHPTQAGSGHPHPYHQQQWQSAVQQAPRGFAHSPHPTQGTPAQGGAPHPGHKPSFPYNPAGSKMRLSGSQGQVLPSHHDTTESSTERHHSAEGSQDSQRLPMTGEDASGEAEAAAISVRALASRFETTDIGRPGPSGSRSCSRQGSMKSDSVSVHRTRSKSESFSRKPKSVLKNKKNKSRPRKSVTFSESLANFANCDDPNSGYESARELSSPRVNFDDRAYYSDDDERLVSHVSHSDNELDDMEDTGSSNSDESPLGEEDACQLCSKRRVDPGKRFCAKCSFYMGRLNTT